MRRLTSQALRLTVLISLLSLAGCYTSFSSKMDSWIGAPIQNWLDLLDKRGGDVLEEVQGPDAEGNKVCVIRIEKKCRVFHTVNANGIITAWRSEGSACKHYTN